MRPAITFQKSNVARQWQRLHMPGLDFRSNYISTRFIIEQWFLIKGKFTSGGKYHLPQGKFTEP